MKNNLKKKLCLFAVDLLNKADCNGFYDLPNVTCNADDVAIEYLALYSELHLYEGMNTAVCFYQYDDVFKSLVAAINIFRYTGETKELEKYAERFKDVDILIAPDISLCADIPFVENLCRIYESRLISLFFVHALDKIVIPNISFVDEKTKEACFIGIDKKSIVAFSVKGLLGKGENGYKLLDETVTEIIKRINPKVVVIYNVSVDNDIFKNVLKKFKDNGIKVIIPNNTLLNRNVVRGNTFGTL